MLAGILTGLVIITFGTWDAESALIGPIEIKKYHEINSKKVCGDRLCSEIADRSSSYYMVKNKHTPLGQYKLGIPLDKIICRMGYELVVKSTNYHPACVSPANVEKLVNNGWALSEEKLVKLMSQPSVEQNYLKPLDEYYEAFPRTQGVSLVITPDIINDQRALIIEGNGWHRLHLVSVRVTNDFGADEFLDSQTSDRGKLYLPWILPEYLPAGMYHFHATDGIHEFEMTIPIAPPK